jgi:hypothetical protein
VAHWTRALAGGPHAGWYAARLGALRDPARRIRAWGDLLGSLDAGARDALRPELERAVSESLADGDGDGDVWVGRLVGTLEPATARRIWAARAGADGWRHTIDPQGDASLFADNDECYADAVFDVVARAVGPAGLVAVADAVETVAAWFPPWDPPG